jgi:hypothetical protein
MPLETFADGESLASVRTKLNAAIAVADSALQPGSGGREFFPTIANNSTDAIEDHWVGS